jgi:two-component sensor histidine kinase
MLNLVRLLEETTCRRASNALIRQIEFNLSVNLAGLYRSLVAPPEGDVVPCSTVLREVVSNLVALFGPAVGAVDLRTDIARIALPGYKRRALVLAASELVINALSHAFKGRHNGRIIVALQMVDCECARLIVADDGVGCAADLASAGCGVAGGLADVLEAALFYRRWNGGGTVADITFPVTSAAVLGPGSS